MREMVNYWYLVVACLICTIIYTIFNFRYAEHFMPLKCGRVSFYIRTVFFSAVFVFFSFEYIPLPVIGSLLYMLILFVYSFHYTGSLGEHTLAAAFFAFNLMAIKGAVYSIICLVLNISMKTAVVSIPAHYMVMIVTYLFAIPILLFVKIWFSIEDIMAIFKTSKIAWLMASVGTICLLILCGDSFLYRYDSQNWILPVYHLLMCVALLAVYYLMLRCFVFLTKFNKMRVTVLEEQIELQIKHYSMHAESIEKFRQLRHDYKAQIRGLSYLINAKEYDKASEYLKSMTNEMDAISAQSKTYSDNVMLDAILNEAARVAVADNIDFSAMVKLPDGLEISEIDLCTLFSNLVNNAIEACKRMSTDKKRYIDIKTVKHGEWTVITFENSFNGVINEVNGVFKTVKKNDNLMHGMGVKKIKEIVESLDNSHIEFSPNIKEEKFSVSIFFGA